MKIAKTSIVKSLTIISALMSFSISLYVFFVFSNTFLAAHGALLGLILYSLSLLAPTLTFKVVTAGLLTPKEDRRFRRLMVTICLAILIVVIQPNVQYWETIAVVAVLNSALLLTALFVGRSLPDCYRYPHYQFIGLSLVVTYNILASSLYTAPLLLPPFTQYFIASMGLMSVATLIATIYFQRESKDLQRP